MAYGRRYPAAKSRRVSNYVARGAAARKAKFAKNRTAVAKIQRKPFVPRVVKNTQSVYQLARAVKQLQTRQLGNFQKRNESCSLATGTLFNQRPIAFCANQFVGTPGTAGASHCPTWKVTIDAAGIYHTTLDQRFAGYDLWPGTVNDAYNPHWGSMDDVVSSEVHTPVSTSLLFEFSQALWNSSTPTWIRIDVVKPRKVVEKSPQHLLTMPEGLPQFQQLACNDVRNRNTINSTYWGHVVKTKWIKLQSTSQSATTALTVIRRCRINLKFPQKQFKTDFDAHIDNLEAHFREQIPPKDLYWVVVSTSDTSGNVKTDIHRKICWRDSHGVAA